MESSNEESLSAVKIAQTSDVHGAVNFPVGCKISPDGLCVLTTTTGDNRLRLYNTVWSNDQRVSDWTMALSCDGGDTVRSYDWYPSMQSSDPSTCCFLGASR
jgi:hypothetical protein